MQAGSITFSTALDNEHLEKDLQSLTKKIEKKEREIAELTEKRDLAQKKGVFDAAVLDEEKAKLQELKDRLADLRNMSKDKSYDLETREGYAAQISDVKQALEDQRTRVNALQKEWNQTESEVERYTSKLAEAENELHRQQDAAGGIVQELDKAKKESGKMQSATEQANERMARFGKRLKEILLSAFVFNVISRALTSLQQLTMKYIKTNDEARRAIAQLKGALLTLAQPLIEVVIPVFTLFVNILTKIITVVAQLVSSLFGKTIKQSQDGAKALHKEANAIGAVGEAAEEASGSLAGFDEINTISTENAKGAGGAGASSGDEIAPDFDFTPGKYKDMIDELMVYLSGALLVIGAILLFSGANIPLGLGLMVLGAAVLAQEIAENWGAVDGKVRDAVNRMLIILGGALLVIGAILCFTGANIPLGLGLMIIGAAMLATAVALNWGALGKDLQNALLTLLQIIGPMIAIIGVILAVSGHLLLGIALIIAGIALFEVGSAGKEDGDFVENIRSRLTEALGIIGSLIAVVGIILLVTGNIVLGLGLIIAGIALFEYSKVADDGGKTIQEKIKTALEETLKVIGPLIAIIGILLIVTGNFLLGLALFIAGVALFEYSKVEDDSGMTMQEKITTVLKKTLEVVSPMIAIVGMLLIVTGHILLGIGLLIAGVALFEYTKVSDDNGKTIEEKITTVLRETAKIAGTFLLVLGLILLFVPGSLPLALGLIAAGAVGLAAGIAPDWNFIQKKFEEIWKGIQNWWDRNVKKYLSADWWKKKGQEVVDGLLGGLKDAWTGLTSWFSGVWDNLFGNRKVSVDINRGGNFGSGSSGSFSGGRMSMRSIPDISNFNIPALAQGAVIPPNREFLAVLGDQRSGTNIEAPLETIKQALAEVMQSQSGGEIVVNITTTLDGRVLARNQVRHINDMTRQSGKPVLLF